MPPVLFLQISGSQAYVGGLVGQDRLSLLLLDNYSLKLCCCGRCWMGLPMVGIGGLVGGVRQYWLVEV